MAVKSRKRSPALFEVIRANGGSGTAAPVAPSEAEDRRPLFRFPKFSFKRRTAAPAGFSMTDDVAPVMIDVAPPPPRVEIPEIRPSLADPTIGRDPFISSSSSSSSRRRRSSGVHLGYDTDRQEVTLKMRYTTAVVSAFTLLVLVGLAYVTGRHGSRSPGALAAVSTETLKKGPAQPGVLDVGRFAGDNGARAALALGGGTPTVTTDRPKSGGTARPSSTQQQPPAVAKNIDPQPTGAAVEDNPKRSIGLNYVIIQSYPDAKTAGEAAAFLSKNGIHCTVEPAPAGFVNNPSWVSVVGTMGFQKIRNAPEFDNYLKAIERASTQFAGTSKFKRFEPHAYRWRQGA